MSYIRSTLRDIFIGQAGTTASTIFVITRTHHEKCKLPPLPPCTTPKNPVEAALRIVEWNSQTVTNHMRADILTIMRQEPRKPEEKDSSPKEQQLTYTLHF